MTTVLEIRDERGGGPGRARVQTFVPDLGMLMPNMGTKSKARPKRPVSRHYTMADALFTRTQQRVLGLLFGQPTRSYYATELIGLVGAGSGAVQRELQRLEQSGLVTVHAVGNRKHYQANADSPLFVELCGIAQKTVGLAEPLRSVLQPVMPQIYAAFVYGSVAKQQDAAASDIDLMLISDSLTYGDVFAALEAAAAQLGRPVNPTLLSRKELRKRIKSGNAFLSRVLSQPKIWIVGDEDDLSI